MAQGISAGVLGNLNFEPYQHTWALEVGNFLACYELLFNSPEQDAIPSNIVQRAEVVQSINSRLSLHGIAYNVPSVANRQSVNGVVDQTLNNVRGLTSPAHCAFVLIGEAACFLREGIRHASSEEQKVAVQEVARNRILDIEFRCPGITLKCEMFWEILSSQSQMALTTQAIQRVFYTLSQPLRILILSASPRDLQSVNLSIERRELESALNSTRFRNAFIIHEVPSCRVRDISLALDRHNPTLLHFSGHGNNSGLCFEDDAGNAQIIPGQNLADLLRTQEGLQLVIMNSCFSADQANVIADAVGNVIGMKNSILDPDAIRFSREFYTALGDGRTIEAAFRRAKAAEHLDATSTLDPVLVSR